MIHAFQHSASRLHWRLKSLVRMSSLARVRDPCAYVHIIPLLQDNYSYIVVDKATGLSACVDPGEAKPITDAVDRLAAINADFKLNYVLSTHRHWDHISGNEELKKLYSGLKIVGTAYEPIPSIDIPLSHGQRMKLGQLSVQALFTPCHTRGHVCFFIEGPAGDPILFSGDTLFVGGCGRFFEGTAADMLDNMNMLGALDRNTLVYCGHEYTLSNIEFLKSIAPELVSEQYKNACSLVNAGIATVPTSIGEELQYNLFMKCNEVDTQELFKAKTAVEAMSILRAMKNIF